MERIGISDKAFWEFSSKFFSWWARWVPSTTCVEAFIVQFIQVNSLREGRLRIRTTKISGILGHNWRQATRMNLFLPSLVICQSRSGVLKQSTMTLSHTQRLLLGPRVTFKKHFGGANCFTVVPYLMFSPSAALSFEPMLLFSAPFPSYHTLW